MRPNLNADVQRDDTSGITKLPEVVLNSLNDAFQISRFHTGCTDVFPIDLFSNIRAHNYDSSFSVSAPVSEDLLNEIFASQKPDIFCIGAASPDQLHGRKSGSVSLANCSTTTILRSTLYVELR